MDTPHAVSDLSQKAQDQVTATIRAYVGDLDDAAADKLAESYVDAYDQTRFAYDGGTDTEQLGFHARLDGPQLWIEISTIARARSGGAQPSDAAPARGRLCAVRRAPRGGAKASKFAATRSL